MKQLKELQSRVKAPKNRKNEFSGFDYRNIEDMLLYVKPIASELGCTIVFTDEVINIGKYNYVRATATIANEEGETVSTSAFAREDEEHSGMCFPQLSGSASSYARKYALCGLLSIDSGGADPDTMDNRPKDKDQTHKKQNEASDNAMDDVQEFIRSKWDSADSDMRHLLSAFHTACVVRGNWLSKFGCAKCWTYFYGDYQNGAFKVIERTEPGVNGKKYWTTVKTSRP